MRRLKLAIVLTCAALIAVGSFDLGSRASAGSDDSRVLTKAKFIHYRSPHAKPANPGGGKKQSDAYYKYISKGARWRVLENFAVNPSNGQGLPEEFVMSAVTKAAAAWEDSGGQIFGELYVDYGAVYDDTKTDGANTVTFGIITDPRVIAVANVWGYYYGSPNTREIVEADVLFNENYAWGDADVDETLMDLQNIAAHEVGHCAGMADLYEAGAVLETMYGYSTEGETIKRDLYKGDIIGITNLYK